MEVNKSYPILEEFFINKKNGVELFIFRNYAKYLTPQLRDGIRFLYTQFIKDKQGVILNDPIPHLSVVQAMLFVNAVVKCLRKTSLIICDQKDVNNFSALFNFWTDKQHLSPVYRNIFRSFCITDFESLDKFACKKWAILIIVSNHDFVKTQKLLKLNAQFKILITDCDVKTNFDKFIGINNMLNPTDDMITQDLHKVAKRSFRHQIVFESILEDYVLRRNFNITNPFTDEFTENLSTMNRESYFAAFVDVMKNDENQLKILSSIEWVEIKSNRKHAKNKDQRTKNKDPTGLKVKRSKRNTEQAETVATEHQIDEENIVYVTRIDNNCLIIPQQTFEDVETFIRNNRPIELKDVKCSDREDHSDIEFDDLQLAMDDEDILQNLTPETVARDEGLTAENIEEIVMNTVNVEVANKINIDKLKSFDNNFDEIEDVVCKKYKGSVLDNLF